jgi:hypothetical protein
MTMCRAPDLQAQPGVVPFPRRRVEPPKIELAVPTAMCHHCPPFTARATNSASGRHGRQMCWFVPRSKPGFYSRNCVHSFHIFQQAQERCCVVQAGSEYPELWTTCMTLAMTCCGQPPAMRTTSPGTALCATAIDHIGYTHPSKCHIAIVQFCLQDQSST